MGLMGSLKWVHGYGKKRCRSLFWRMRAAVKKALKKGGKQQLKFQYDPSSYALNFDDGCCRNVAEGKKLFRDARVQEFPFPDVNNATWVYVIWVKTN
ncbi:hypothetical protein L6164_036601 [Bauhinia variegata]|uniref:Uncharacterized protein n=1 Tax=Bauhinia variegata TaxID=167791 RepID=A0ACB9KHN7_BAUVA|nr:hypothetical protein L6164_036601 [Bauhinia variegata]